MKWNQMKKIVCSACKHEAWANGVKDEKATTAVKWRCTKCGVVNQ